MLALCAPFALRIAVALSLILPANVPAVAQDRAVVFLRSSHAKCLAQHADDYIKLQNDPLLIFTGFCEKENFSPSPEQIAAATSNNVFEIGVFEGMIAFKTSAGVATLPKNAMATAVVLTTAQLACLRGSFEGVVNEDFPEIQKVHRIDVAEIDFGKCGK